jgi:peptidoglycan/LPS O-acetylase OafA/YrhL
LSPIAYRGDLDGIRAIAVVAVLLFHYQLDFAAGGFVGVDVFFVLSGFLMTAILWPEAPLTLKATVEFYKRRARRIVPAAYFVLFVAAIAVLAVGTPPQVTTFADQMLAAALFVVNFTFWSENTYFASDLYRPLLHYWSLAVEVQYYALFPLVLLLVRRSSVGLALLFVGSAVACALVTTVSPKTAFFWTPFRLAEFLVGTYAYLAIAGGRFATVGQSARNAVTIVALVTLALSVYFYSAATPFPGFAVLVPTIATGALIAFGEGTAASRLYDNRLFRHIGRISYSIYLWHFVVVSLALNHLDTPARLPLLGAMTVLIYALSLLSYRYIEQPFRDRRRLSDRQCIGAMATAVAGVAGICMASHAYNGFAFRYSASENAIYTSMQDRETYRCGKLNRLLAPFSSVCVLHDAGDGARKVLLWGDSHADSLKPALERLAAEQKFTLYLNAMNCSAGESQGICASNAQVLNEIAALHIDEVIFHDATGKEAAGFWPQWNATLARLKELAVGATVISPVPWFDRPVPARLLEQAAAGVSPHVSVTVADYRRQLAEHDAFRQAISATYPFVRFVDVESAACPQGACPAHHDFKVFYFDSGHLTVSGALRLLPALRAALPERSPAQP